MQNTSWTSSTPKCQVLLELILEFHNLDFAQTCKTSNDIKADEVSISTNEQGSKTRKLPEVRQTPEVLDVI